MTAWAHEPAVSHDGAVVSFIARTDRDDVYVARDGHIERISEAPDGTPSNGDSHHPRLSADGTRVAFSSGARNLVDGPPFDQCGIFVRDLAQKRTIHVTRQANGPASRPALSADGKHVAFQSYSTNLVPGIPPVPSGQMATARVFIQNLETGQTHLVSAASDGTPCDLDATDATVSGDGRYVAFASWCRNLFPHTPRVSQVYLHDCQTGQTRCISVAPDGSAGNEASHCPDISADGRFVTFQSKATNLVGASSQAPQVYVYDCSTGTVSRIADGQSPCISADGRYIAYKTGYADNQKVYVHDRHRNLSRCASETAPFASDLAISGEGQHVVFTAAPRGVAHVFQGVNPTHLGRLTEDDVAALSNTAPASIESDGTDVLIDGVRIPRRQLVVRPNPFS